MRHCQRCCTSFSTSLERGGRSNAYDSAVDKADRQIDRLALDKDYSILGLTIFEQILVIYNTALMSCLDSVDSLVRKITAHNVAMLALSLATALD